MSQFFLVSGAAFDLVASAYESGIAIFKSIWGRSPDDQHLASAERIALFRSPKSGTPKICRQPRSAYWICGAGTWFCERVTGESALRRLVEHPQRWADDPGPWLREVDGQFAIILAGEQPGEVLAVTDRLGMLHVYTAHINGCIAVSTSSMALAILTRAKWDMEGCRQFLTTNTVLETPRTLFGGIEKLGPGRVFTFRGGRLCHSRKYWDLSMAMRRTPRGDVFRLATELRDALQQVHEHFPRPLMDLTGGFDTRGILGAMLKLGVPVSAIVNGSDNSSDVRAAEVLSKEFGVSLHRPFRQFRSIEELWAQAKATILFTDGECDALYYARALTVHSRMAEQFDASIVGIDGEIVQGKWWELLFPFTGWRKRVDPYLVARRRLLYDGEEPGLLAHEFPESLVEHVAEVIRQINREIERFPNTAQMDNVYLTLVQQRLYGRIASSTQRIWPCISPYGFRGPFEVAVSAPPSVRVRRRMSRRLIEHQNARLASFPTDEGYPAMPLRVTTAHRFLPLIAAYGPLVWRRALLQVGVKRAAPTSRGEQTQRHNNLLTELYQLDEVRELMTPERMVTRELYDTAVLKRVLQERNDGTNPGTSLATRILTLELLGRAVRR
jgi:hypothetical protein